MSLYSCFVFFLFSCFPVWVFLLVFFVVSLC